MKSIFLLIGLILFNIKMFSQTPDSFEKIICANESGLTIPVNTEIGASSKICDAATELFYSMSGDEDIVKDWKVNRIGKTPGPFTSEIDIDWNGDMEGVIIINVEYKRLVHEGWGRCEWKDKQQAYTYRITRESKNPGGALTGDTEYILTGDQSAGIDLTYDGSSGESKEVKEIKFFVNGEYLVTKTRKKFGSGIFSTYWPFIHFHYETNEIGQYHFTTEVLNGCSEWLPGPERIVDVFPSCHDPNIQTATISLSGNTMTSYPEGMEIRKDLAYTMDIVNITDVEQHYDISHDGGAELTIVNGILTVNAGLGSYRVEVAKKSGRETCPNVEDLHVFVGGHDYTIEDDCLINLPADLNDLGFEVIGNEPFLKHFAATVSSKRGLIIKPGITLTQGAELILDYQEPQVDEENELDLDKNFVQSTAYDEYNRIVAQGRQYFDEQGRPTQSQYKNIAENVLIASEVLYDAKGRAVLSTLAAPVAAGDPSNQSDECGQDVQRADLVKFDYKEDFVLDVNGNPYDYTNFDLAKEQNPDPVGDDEEGTLGWYYGSHNGSSLNNPKFNEPLVATTAYPYSRTLFHHDGSGEAKSSSGPGDAFRAGGGHLGSSDKMAVDDNDSYLQNYIAIRTSEFGLSDQTALDGNFFKTERIDGEGRRAVAYVDFGGNAIISLYFGKQSTPLTRSYQFYNDKGQLLVSMTPNGWEQYNGSNFGQIDKTTYFYDNRGRMEAMEETDAGRTEYVYRNDGTIRFSQNAEQRHVGDGQFSYTNYDELGRPVESGAYTPDTGGMTFKSTAMDGILENKTRSGGLNFASGTKTDWIESYYDLPDPQIPVQRTQRFLHGAVSYTKNGAATTWYSYDDQGRVEWMVQDLGDLGVKTLDYHYGPLGNVELVAYQKADPTEDFYHFYEYDEDGRLTKAFTATSEPLYNAFGELTNPEVLTEQAAYEYYLHGPLKRVELANNLQGIDYIYTAAGALKGINHADTGKDPGVDGDTNGFREDVFGMTLDYYNNDYTGAGYQSGNLAIDTDDHAEQYNGNIRAMSWHSPVDGGKPRSYVYDYDDRQQLSAATWGNPVAVAGNNSGFIADINNSFKVNIPSFDLNGNIEQLHRKGEIGQTTADFSYNYTANSNKLSDVQHGPDEYANYQYNAIGQMTQQDKGGEIIHIQYDVSGKVTGVYATYDASNKEYSDPLVAFTYDDRGFRLSKTSYDEAGAGMLRTWYVRDASGNVVSTYMENLAGNSAPEQYEVPIYGSGRLGMYRPNALLSNYMYELNDHLGNVRAVIGEGIELEYLATMESERDETADFMINNRVPTADFINHTPPLITVDGVEETIVNPNEVIRLNNARSSDLNLDGEAIGATFQKRVYPGDVVKMEVYVKYRNFDQQQTSDYAATTMISFLGTAFGGMPTLLDRPAMPGTIFDFLGGGNALFDNEMSTLSDDRPKAFLNYIVYDDKFQLEKFDMEQVGIEAEIPDDVTALTHPHQKLELEVTIEKEGYIYVYLSSEDKQNMDVWFDDFKVTHTLNDIVAGGDYYPFGSVMAGREITRDDYRFGYQGQFAEKDEETGWNAFELRMFDPVIGRWMATDPYGQFSSPYLGMGNNPVSGVDSDGGVTSPIFNKDGSKFLGVDSEGYSGDIILMDESDYNTFTGGNNSTLDHSIAEMFAANEINGAAFLGTANISLENRSFIYTHVLNQMENIDFSQLHNGKVSIYTGFSRNDIPLGYNDPKFVGRYNAHPPTGTVSVNVNKFEELGQVETIQSYLGIHEYYGHVVRKLGFGANKTLEIKSLEHQMIYKIQRVHKATFNNLPTYLKEEIYFRSKNPEHKW